MYILYYILLKNDLNALNRMLIVKFELMIDWYTNKGQFSSTGNERNDVSL